jgi:hypothetical protein
MAGAGYKLFNTGDVLTAAQVNTYLMQQTIMVFADSTARTTALSGVLAEGMTTYLQDTNSLEFWNGSAWVAAVGDITGVTAGTGLTGGGTSGTVTLTNDMATTITTKGDLVVGTGSGTYARLAAGEQGASIVADSAATTGLRWQGNYAAGKNKIINGDFRLNQRAFTSTTTTAIYTFDRWRTTIAGTGTTTFSAQTFTLGAAPVAGYEGQNYLDINTTGQSGTGAASRLDQRIESVRTVTNSTVVVSFWAKAASGTPKISVELEQNFGTGGSPSTSVRTYAGQATISTTWARYSVSVALPSISGKTLGTNNDDFIGAHFWVSAGTDFDARTGSLGIQTNTFSIWGVQFEQNNVATAFQTATGTLQGERSACERYYWRYTGGNGNFSAYGNGIAYSTINAEIVVPFPTSMRISPTASVEYSTLAVGDGAAATAVTSLGLIQSNQKTATLQVTVASGLTQWRPYSLITNNNSTTAYLGISAEL